MPGWCLKPCRIGDLIPSGSPGSVVGLSLAWPRPFLRWLVGRGEREGREEEGSGDSEQDAVANWNVIIEIIFRKCNIARDLLQVCYTSSIDHTLTQLEHTARAMAIKEERCSVCLKDLPKSSTRRRETHGDVRIACKLSSLCLHINCL